MYKTFSQANRVNTRWPVIFCLVIAGEMIFSLPFHVARFFRPTMLEVFGLSNAALGDVLAIYGITAMLAYFPGGVIADQFSARKLMTLSLLATALGGLYLARIPDRTGLAVLFAWWGFTSILLFWAALIRATREWGGALTQGRAFGFLDGGRGLVAAGAAMLAVVVLSANLPVIPGHATATERHEALQSVIYFYTGMTFAVAILVWWIVPDSGRVRSATPVNSLARIYQVLCQRVVWWQALIVVCAYCGYKGLDFYGLYAVELLGMNEVEAARFTSLAAYIRPVAAISAGFIVERLLASKVIGVMFLLLLAGYALLAILPSAPSLINIIYANLIVTFGAVFAIRGVYFVLLEETRISDKLTGTAVGLISLVGFTPDVFFAPLAGRLLDNAPGSASFQHFFALLAVISAIGMIAALGLARGDKKRPQL